MAWQHAGLVLYGAFMEKAEPRLLEVGELPTVFGYPEDPGKRANVGVSQGQGKGSAWRLNSDRFVIDLSSKPPPSSPRPLKISHAA